LKSALVSGAVVCLSAVFLVATAAEELELAGIHGDEAGCKVAANGGFFYSDEGLILTSDRITRYASDCEIVQTLTARDGSRVVTALCDEEGDESRTVGMFSIWRSNSDPAMLIVSDADGLYRGEVMPCS
jgi:hypothetical protein